LAGGLRTRARSPRTAAFREEHGEHHREGGTSMRKAILVTLGLLLFAVPVLAAPGLTEVVVPQYMEAANSTTRLPVVFRLTLTGLNPSATYRYFTQAVISTDLATANGAGNPLFMDDSYTFYSTSASMATPGTNCSQFTTDAAGNYTGWFGLVGTGNARFTAGNTINARICLNDGAGGTSVVTRLTTTSGVTTIAFGATSADGSGIYQTASAFTARNVVALYGNTAGTGRPLATGIVQNEGATVASAVAFYLGLDGTASAWGTIIPNNLATGVMRIEEQAYATGSVVQSLTDLDGIWNPGSINTVNPTAAAAGINLTGVQTESPVSVEPTTFGRLKSLYR
jgi:hypothetical protein